MTETDVDCGGADCSPCAVGQTCDERGDCLSTAVCFDGVCAHSPDCSEFSYCEKGRCQPPKFPRPTRLFVTQMLEQLKQRVLEHIWDFGKDDIDSSARMWGGNGTNATEAAVSAAKVRLQLHAGRADPLLDQDAAVIRNLLATAVGAGVNADSILQLQILQIHAPSSSSI